MNRKLFLAAAALGVAATGIAPASANELPTPATPAIPGILAPTADVGTDVLTKGTLQFNTSTGAADSFSVGTNTSISASASASSTSDYGVTSTASFGLGFQVLDSDPVVPSTINQFIGSSGSSQSTVSQIEQAATLAAQTAVTKELETQTKTTLETQQDGTTRQRYWWWANNSWESGYEEDKETYEQKREDIMTNTYESAYNSAYSALTQSSALSGTITGSFEKSSDTTSASNQVTVRGIGANNTITAADDAGFTTSIQKNLVVVGSNQAAIDAAKLAKLSDSTVPIPDLEYEYGAPDSAGTASGSASGNVSTTASANANSTEFVSSFVQAY